jgi:hypothetical protein
VCVRVCGCACSPHLVREYLWGHVLSSADELDLLVVTQRAVLPCEARGATA